MKKEPVNPKEVKVTSRITGFNEVVSRYTEKEALEEAARCIQCKNPVCITGCPVDIDIKKFIAQIKDKDYKGAYLTIREKNDFPSMCGRIFANSALGMGPWKTAISSSPSSAAR